jgi:hypothetical protein
VRQILVNLLSNAVKFTEPGGRVAVEAGTTTRPDPEARLHPGERWTFLRVVDSGTGIAPEKLEAIFAPFVQVDTGHTRAKDGSGLGLTISRRLARLMGGDLTARSRLGQGSSFTLWLPAPPEHAASARDRVALEGHDPQVKGLGEVGEALLRETDAILDAFAARLRSDSVVPTVRSLKFTQIVDHLATFLVDVAGALVVLEESGGRPSPLLADATDIQRLIGERHGQQRARLGWTVPALQQEYAVLREEIERAVRRCFLGETGARIDEALAVTSRLVAQAEEVSIGALMRATDGGEGLDTRGGRG